MGKNFTFGCLFYLACTFIVCVAPTRTIAAQTKVDTAELRIRNRNNSKNSYLKNGFRLAFPALKPANSSVAKLMAAKVASDDDKILTNVQVFPNPVKDSEQINVKYSISRNAMVSIKVMDVLGNSVLTLLQQRVDPGEQKFTYNINKQLTSGFYFVRVVVGSESIIKRISVL